MQCLYIVNFTRTITYMQVSYFYLILFGGRKKILLELRHLRGRSVYQSSMATQNLTAFRMATANISLPPKFLDPFPKSLINRGAFPSTSVSFVSFRPPRQIPLRTVSVRAEAGTPAAPEETKLFIIYYSMYGHVETLAREIKKGADTVDGVDARLYQVAETLPDEVLQKMYAPPKSTDVPVITTKGLTEADGFIFGFPTRFGMLPAQFKAFFDTTGGLWKSGALVGKPAGMFTSTSSQGSGHETTALTAITQLAHHGMIFVPTGYTFGDGMFVLDEVKGGSAYGAGTFSGGDGSRQPSKLELAHAFHQGKYIAGIVKKFKGGSA